MEGHLVSRKITLQEVRAHWPSREKDVYKGNFGHVLLIGGNERMGGAIQLAANACILSGAGLTTVATAGSNLPAIHSVRPEAMVVAWEAIEDWRELMANKDTLAIGPGLGGEPSRFIAIMKALQPLIQEKVVLLDADALTLYSQFEDELAFLSEAKGLIFTPHMGEWRRLCQEKIAPTDKEKVLDYAQNKHLTLVLKGAPSQVFLGRQGLIYENTRGNPGMAIGGMGDTLTGILAGLVGQFQSVDSAVLSGVFLHSYAADLIYQKDYVVIPSRLVASLPEVMKNLEGKNV